jgi:hypothetical protein
VAVSALKALAASCFVKKSTNAKPLIDKSALTTLRISSLPLDV